MEKELALYTCKKGIDLYLYERSFIASTASIGDLVYKVTVLIEEEELKKKELMLNLNEPFVKHYAIDAKDVLAIREIKKEEV